MDIDINEHTLKIVILTLLWLEYLWELYLGVRQYRKVIKTKDVPPELQQVMSKDLFEKSRLYTIARSRFGFVKDTFSILLSTVVIYSDILALVWDYSEQINSVRGEVTTSCIWLFILMTASTIIDLPSTIYHTFVLEEKFGFNKQTAGFFAWDKTKSFVLTQILTLAFSSVIIVIIKNGGEYFFVWLWVAASVLSLVLYTIYPSVIAPLFDKFTPLPEGELRTQIESLASELKFPLAKLYVVEGSKRSSHSNAYFYGIFKEKRIVLFDTLLKKEDGSGCTNEEVLAVLTHELGHWSHNHIYKLLILTEINYFLLFAFFSYMFKFPQLYKAVGFYNSQPVLVGLMVVLQYVMMPYNALLGFLMICLSRKFEFQADNFAVRLNKGDKLITALIQLTKDNLSFPVYDSLYSAWHNSHPTLLERIEGIKRDKKLK